MKVTETGLKLLRRKKASVERGSIKKKAMSRIRIKKTVRKERPCEQCKGREGRETWGEKAKRDRGMAGKRKKSVV